MNSGLATDQLRGLHLPTEPGWWPPAPGWWILAVLVFVLIAIPLLKAEALLQTPEEVSGYALFVCILFLGFFRVRKHLSMFSMISGSSRQNA